MIDYRLPVEEFVTVKIFNVVASEVNFIVIEFQFTGLYELNLDVSHLSNGIYLYRIDAGSFHDSKKMLWLK